jgi:tRNA (cmo5U34)-methyltransferase
MQENESAVSFNIKNAAAYDELACKAVFGYDQLFVMALSLFAEDNIDNANVLVVGSGTGMELKTFGTLMQNWRITGVDPSEEMIKLSRAKVIEHNLNDRVLLHHGFVDSLPEGEQYEFATLIFVLRFIQKAEDQKSLFSTIAKRLKPGGKFIIIDQYGDTDTEEFKTMFNSWKSFMKFSGSPMELVKKISQQASEKSFINEQQLQEALSEAGFEKIKCIYKSLIHGGWIAQKRF